MNFNELDIKPNCYLIDMHFIVNNNAITDSNSSAIAEINKIVTKYTNMGLSIKPLNGEECYLLIIDENTQKLSYRVVVNIDIHNEFVKEISELPKTYDDICDVRLIYEYHIAPTKHILINDDANNI